MDHLPPRTCHWAAIVVVVLGGVAGAAWLGLVPQRWDSALWLLALAVFVAVWVRERSCHQRLRAECTDLTAYHQRALSENVRREDALQQEVERRRHAEARLRGSEERLRLILSNLPIIVFTLDRGGRISLLEGRGLEVLNGEPENMLGGLVVDEISGDADFVAAVELALSGQPSRVDVVCCEQSFEVHYQPLFDEAGCPDGAVAVAVDISERAQVDQLKREFIASVTHELRTPLTSIIGALGLLTGGAMGPMPEGAQRMLVIARENSERLLRLINDILDLDKVDAGKLLFHFRATQLEDLLEQSLEAHGPYAAEFGVCLERQNVVAGTCVSADPDRLLQVLSNLLSNAVKHAPEGSCVVLSARIEGERVSVEVSDEGPGVPESTRNYLFERFTPAAATGRGGGSGLGLSIARAIVERHGGTLDFRNREAGGATFFFDLPICPCDAAPYSSPGH